MGEEIAWATSTVLSFLKDLEGLPILWDTKSPQHKMAKRKCDIWSQLAKKYNCPPDELKKKWQSLQAAYKRERIREAVSSGQYKSRWFAYSHMNFIAERYNLKYANIQRQRMSHSNIQNFETIPVNETNKQVVEDEEANETSETEGEEEASEEVNSNGVEAESNSQARIFLPTHGGYYKRMRVDPHRAPAGDGMGSRTFHILNQASPCEFSERNEYTIFGEYVAKKLSKMDDRLCAIVQHEIHNILFQAEMGHFRNCSFQVRESVNSDLSSLHSVPTPSSTSHHQPAVNTIYEMNQ